MRHEPVDGLMRTVTVERVTCDVGVNDEKVAIDLRRICAGLKINAELERMADLAEDIAERALRLAQLPEVPIPATRWVTAPPVSAQISSAVPR